MTTPTVVAYASGYPSFSGGQTVSLLASAIQGYVLGIIVFANGNFATSAAPTYAGTAMTQLGFGTHNDGTRYWELWGLVAPTAGTANFVANYTGGGNAKPGLALYSFSGVDQTTPTSAPFYQDSGGTTSSISANVFTPNGDELVIGRLVVASGGVTIHATGTGATERENNSSSYGQWGVSEQVAAGSPTFANWSISPADVCSAMGIAIRGPSAPSAVLRAQQSL